MYNCDRLAAFSDGVMAIAITILVLGLEVPSAEEVQQTGLNEFLLDSLRALGAYVVSFVLIGTYWLQHYVIFHYIERADRTLVALNGLFLLTVSFLPFPTGVQATYRHDELAMVFYGISQALCGLSLLALWLYVGGRHRLVAQDLPGRYIRGMAWRISLTPIISLVAIGVSFLNILLSHVVFVAIPIVYLSRRLADRVWVPARGADPGSGG